MHLKLYWTDSALDFAALPNQLILAIRVLPCAG